MERSSEGEGGEKGGRTQKVVHTVVGRLDMLNAMHVVYGDGAKVIDFKYIFAEQIEGGFEEGKVEREAWRSFLGSRYCGLWLIVYDEKCSELYAQRKEGITYRMFHDKWRIQVIEAHFARGPDGTTLDEFPVHSEFQRSLKLLNTIIEPFDAIPSYTDYMSNCLAS